MIESLKKEYELRYRIMRYKKLHKRIIYNMIEKNNVTLLFESLKSLEDPIWQEL